MEKWKVNEVYFLGQLLSTINSFILFILIQSRVIPPIHVARNNIFMEWQFGYLDSARAPHFLLSKFFIKASIVKGGLDRRVQIIATCRL